MGRARIGSSWPRRDHSSCSLGCWLRSCPVGVPVPASLLASCSVPQPFAWPGSFPPSWGSGYEPAPGLALAFLGTRMPRCSPWPRKRYTGLSGQGEPGRACTLIPSLTRPPAWEAWLGREQKAGSASLGGCLLHAASGAPLNSLLNHLPSNYSSRVGRGETGISPPALGTLGISQPVQGPADLPKALFVLWLPHSSPSQGSPGP